MKPSSDITVFGGRGFVGSAFCKNKDNVTVKERDDYSRHSSQILYFISTVDNYNVLENPHIDIDTNLKVLMSVLSGCEKGDTFNFISSWFVYGDCKLPAKEKSHCDPKGFYSITKRAAEQLLISYCETFEINYRILRLANVVGRNDNKVSKRKNALQYLINELRENKPIQLYGGGNFTRDYTHVEDAVKAIDLVLQKGNLNTIYNIGNGVPLVFKDLIFTAAKLLNTSSKISTMEPTAFHKKIQVESFYMDNTKLKKLGYQPSWSTHDMIKSLL